MTTNNLINILKDHNIKVLACNADSIKVIGVYSKDGIAFEQEEVLEAQYTVIMAWLGY